MKSKNDSEFGGIDIKSILALAVRENASDIHFKSGLPPILRIDGRLVPIKNVERLLPEEVRRLAFKIMSQDNVERFKQDHQVDFAYSLPGLGRFRTNVFQQRGTPGIVFRTIPTNILSFNELNLPNGLEKISMEQRGLVLVTGVTGCGKSTTLASIINYINNKRTSHIITIEDPIEFLHKDKKSIITQREIGVDTESFTDALRGALRQDPDVILVGEMRDIETIEIALTAAETGHLVLSTLHTVDATESINRIVSSFPPYQQKQIRLQLASVLKAVISQRLLPKKDGKGRVPAVELLISTAMIRECIIEKDRTIEIHDAIAKGHTTYGMQTFDQSIMDLLKKNLVSYEEALRQASNPSDFALEFKGISSVSDQKWEVTEEKDEDEEGKDWGIDDSSDKL